MRSEMQTMFYAGPGGAWSQENPNPPISARTPSDETVVFAGPGGGWTQDNRTGRSAGARTASDAIRPIAAKNALRKKIERANTTALWATLELLAPSVEANKEQPGHRSKALRGRVKEELLKDVVHAVRLARRLVAPGSLEQAYTTQAGAGLLAIDMSSGAIAHQSLSFQALTRFLPNTDPSTLNPQPSTLNPQPTSWMPAEARGNIRVSLESRDGDDFHSFCQAAVRDAGEPYGDTFLDRDKVVGRSITVRFFTRAPGPPGVRNPEWLLMVRPVKLTLVQMQLAGGSPAGTPPFFGQREMPEAVGVFAADLSGDGPSQWTLQVFFFFTLVTGPRRSLSLELRDARVYEPQIRARLGAGGARPVSSRLGGGVGRARHGGGANAAVGANRHVLQLRLLKTRVSWWGELVLASGSQAGHRRAQHRKPCWLVAVAQGPQHLVPLGDAPGKPFTLNPKPFTLNPSH